MCRGHACLVHAMGISRIIIIVLVLIERSAFVERGILPGQRLEGFYRLLQVNFRMRDTGLKRLTLLTVD